MTAHPNPHVPKACEPIHYTSREFLTCRRELRDILIAPFDESKCKGIGYNISPSELCYSVKKKHLLQIHRTEQEIYVLIPPHDTVLTLSHEYLQISAEVAGCFLSRLRPVTQGLGNISTTLDPCWKGMLLLAINNPSSRKVKLTLSKKKDDKMDPVAISTMVLWKTAPPKDSKNEVLTFRLDNPAMRTDIWSELIAEPYRSLRPQRYRQFQRLIRTLTNYQPDENNPDWLIQMQHALDQLQIAVESAPRQFNTVREILLRINHLECEQMSPALLNKLRELYHFGEKGPATDLRRDFHIATNKIIEKLSNPDSEQRRKDTEAFIGIIQMIYNECDYQKLCFQVEGIHQIIAEKTQYHWHFGGIKRIWHTFVRPNISAFIASIVIAGIFFLWKDADMKAFLPNAIICIIPSILSIVFNCKKHDSNE